LTKDKIFVTSEDHGQIFGLPKPVDAAERVIKSVQGQAISKFIVAEITSDLLLYFSNGAQIHILNTSCGYESWEICFKNLNVICMGGGSLTTFGGEKDNSEQANLNRKSLEQFLRKHNLPLPKE
jgi:hypothetical protein